MANTSYKYFKVIPYLQLSTFLVICQGEILTTTGFCGIICLVNSYSFLARRWKDPLKRRGAAERFFLLVKNNLIIV